MSHNFQVFDATGANMTEDTEYSLNTSRLNGVSNGVADPALYNKAQYQASVMVKAIADFLTASGQSVSDNNLAGIVAALNNVRTTTVLTCLTVNGVHALTGLSATSGLITCVFKADATYVAGDTFTVNGAIYAVQTPTGAALPDGAFTAGAMVQCVLNVNGSQIGISPPSGGGLSIGSAAPADTGKGWIDIGNGGILKYYNGSAWVAAKATWG